MERPIVTVGALIFNSKQEILLIRSPKWKGKYTGPAGKVKLGETLKEAVIREVKEETGLSLIEVKFLKMFESVKTDEYEGKGNHFVGADFICKTEDSEIKLNHEADHFIWIKPEEAVKENVDSITKESIKKFLEMKG